MIKVLELVKVLVLMDVMMRIIVWLCVGNMMADMIITSDIWNSYFKRIMVSCRGL